MKHTTFLYSALLTTPQRFPGGKNVVIFSDWPLTVVTNGRKGESKYERVIFLTLKNVEELWIQRENLAVPNGQVEMLSFDDGEFVPPATRPIELWGNHSVETSTSTAAGTSATLPIQLPGTTWGYLQEVSLQASAAGVNINRVRILDGQGAPVQLFGRRFPITIDALIVPEFPGVKVPNIHNIQFFYTAVAGSSVALALNYKIAGG